MDVARRQYPDSGYDTCGVFGCQTQKGPPQQVLLIGSQEAEHLQQIAQIADQAVLKGDVRVFKFYHGTSYAKNAFEQGVDASKGGGQLGPGFYVTPNRDAAEWFASAWPGGGQDTPKLLKFTIPEDELSKLKIEQLTPQEFDALSRAWGGEIPSEYQYLIEDYDALLAPLDDMGWQLKFNPRAEDFLNQYIPEFEGLD